MSNDIYYSVSRIEGETVILEFPDRTMQKISLFDLPDGIKEGNILYKNEKGQFAIDKNEEENRKKHLLELQKRIFR